MWRPGFRIRASMKVPTNSLSSCSVAFPVEDIHMKLVMAMTIPPTLQVQVADAPNPDPWSKF